VVRLLEEPVAAAIAYGLHEDDRERLVVVYDFGGEEQEGGDAFQRYFRAASDH
jgi:hypothetical protein